MWNHAALKNKKWIELFFKSVKIVAPWAV